MRLEIRCGAAEYRPRGTIGPSILNSPFRSPYAKRLTRKKIARRQGAIGNLHFDPAFVAGDEGEL
jgi:hypothetical protein